jgi:hypothetical protein
MGFDFILTIMLFGIGLESETVISVKERESVGTFDVTITRSLDRKVSLVVTKVGNEIDTIFDDKGEEIEKYDDEWNEFVDMLQEYIK